MIAELVIALLSTVGNLLVCVAVGLNRKLQTVTNYFLVSLAVADICVGSLAIPCAILTDLGIPQHNLYLCLLMLSVLIMLTQSSIFSLLAIAIERYIAIFMPFQYHRLMTARNAVLVLYLYLDAGFPDRSGAVNGLAQASARVWLLFLRLGGGYDLHGLLQLLCLRSDPAGGDVPHLRADLRHSQTSDEEDRGRARWRSQHGGNSKDEERDEDGHFALPGPLPFHILLDSATYHQLLPAAVSVMSCASTTVTNVYHSLTCKFCC